MLWDMIHIAWADLEIRILPPVPPECWEFQHGPPCQLAILHSWCQINVGEQIPLGLDSGGVSKLPGLGKPLFLLEYVSRNYIRKVMKSKLDLQQRDLSYSALANSVIQLIKKDFSIVLLSSRTWSATLCEVVRMNVQLGKLWSYPNKQTPRKHKESGCRKGGCSIELRAMTS